MQGRDIRADDVPFVRSVKPIDDKHYLLYAGPGSENMNKGITMLNSLAKLYADHMQLSEMIPDLLTIIIRQQQQVDELSRQLVDMKKSQLYVKVQDSFRETIETLLDKKVRHIGEAEATFHFSSRPKAERPEGEGQRVSQNSSGGQSRNIKDAIKGVVNRLAALSLTMDYDKKELDARLGELDRDGASFSDEFHSAVMVLKFREIEKGGAP